MRELKGNKYFTKGKVGNRSDKQTGERESRKQQMEKVRGANYSHSVIKSIVEYSKTVDEYRCSQPESWKQIKKQLTISEEQFQAIRTLQSIEEYSKVLVNPKNDGSVQQNAIMNIVGFDHTGHMNGEVRYGALNNKHLQLIQGEINF